MTFDLIVDLKTKIAKNRCYKWKIPSVLLLMWRALIWLTGDECRIILFEELKPQRAIKGHVIRSEEVVNEGFCRTICYMEPNCVYINVKPLQGGKYKCELNNATADESQLVFLGYLAVEVSKHFIVPYIAFSRLNSIFNSNQFDAFV